MPFVPPFIGSAEIISTVAIAPAIGFRPSDFIGWTPALLDKYTALLDSGGNQYLQNGTNDPDVAGPPELDINKNRLNNIRGILLLDEAAINEILEEYPADDTELHDGANYPQSASWSIGVTPVMTSDPPDNGPNKLVIGSNKIIVWKIEAIEIPEQVSGVLGWSFIGGAAFPHASWREIVLDVVRGETPTPNVRVTLEGDHSLLISTATVNGGQIEVYGSSLYEYIPFPEHLHDPNTIDPPIANVTEYSRRILFDKEF